MAADASPPTASDGAGAAMELIAELEAQLERAQAEKERLQRDVDELCKQQVGQGLLGVAFGSSEAVARIHARRVSGLEDQVRGWKAQAAELAKQAAEMQAEIRELHRAKTLTQQSLREAEERTRLVRAEVAYFQDQVAGALSQRDEALLEIEQAKERCENALEEAQQAKEQCEQAQKERERAMKELAELKAEVAKFLQEEPTEGQPIPEGTYNLADSNSGEPQQERVGEKTDVKRSDLLETKAAEVSRVQHADDEDTDQQSLEEEEQDVSKSRSKEMPDTSGTLEAERAEMQERLSALDLQVHTLSQENAKLRTQIEAAEAANKRIEMHGHESDIDTERQEEKESALDQEVGTSSDRKDEENLQAALEESNAGSLGGSSSRKEMEATAIAMSAKVRDLEAEVRRLRAEAEVERAKWREELVKAYGDTSMQSEQTETPSKPESVGLLGASSALQAQLSKLLNEPDTATTFSEGQGNQLLFDSQPATLADSTGLTNDVKNFTSPEAAASAQSIAETAPSETLRILAETSTKPLDLSDDFDVRKALAQAAQEKVAALVLLSQQEERHEMEMRQNQNLHTRLGEVQERLAEVVQEKVAALMQVAELKEEVLSLKDTESRLAALLQQQQGGSTLSSRLLPAAWARPPTAKDETHQDGAAPLISPSPSTASLEERDRSSPAKAGWFSKAASAPGSRRPSNGTESSGPERWYKGWIPRPDVSKRPAKSDGWSSGEETSSLRVENAALQERVATIKRLTESVHQLRTRLTEAVSRVSENEASVRAALDAVGSVATEAGQLKIALGGALPVSYSETAEGSASENESGEKSAADTAGLEMVELLIAAASLQRELLENRSSRGEGLLA